MRTLYIDCQMGAAGDMLTAALIELLPNPDEFLQEVNSLKIPGVTIQKQKSVKQGVAGTRISVKVNGEEESAIGHAHIHSEHGERYEHSHVIRGINEITSIVAKLNLDKKVEADVLAVYRLIAEAESTAHGIPLEKISFCEVGMMDAVSDIASVCLLINRLAPDEIIVSPINVGSGYIKCAHGVLPVPAPATACILKDAPMYRDEIKGELCTPTGAALLKHFASEYGNMPVMKTKAIGYGMGTKDFDRPNCVRVFWGDTADKTEYVCELACNIDDMTAEAISFATQRLLEEGALEVFTLPAGMKKNRPGTIINIICAEDDKEKILSLLFKHTTTLGVRETLAKRYVLDRNSEALATPYGIVRRKKSSGYGVSRSKYEYDDLCRIAREQNISIIEAQELVEKA